MAFDASQPTHKALRSVIAEKTSKLVVWTGSGLSAGAGLPTWADLKTELVGRLRRKAHELKDADSAPLLAMADRAAREPNHWLAFHLLKTALGQSSYRATIREALRPAHSVPCPEAYCHVWKLKPAGVISLNLDRLTTRALAQVEPGTLPTEFHGRDAGSHLHCLKSPRRFIANLHGVLDDESTWVFTHAELKNLMTSRGYHEFLTACFGATTTLFLGIGADDLAAGGHLASLAGAGVDTGAHYWLTHRDDMETDKWAEETGVGLIRYDDHDNHTEVLEFLLDILHFVPDEGPAAPPVFLDQESTQTDTIPKPSDLTRLEAEEIRGILNGRAKTLLRAGTPASYAKYERFSKKYDQAIYRAWYTTIEAPDNMLLGYELIQDVGRGAFGQVYRGTSPDGDEVAIKVLLENVRKDPELLGSFRRGVRSMSFLGQNNVNGMVAYRDASEIPAFVVMDWIEGPTLAQAFDAKQIDNWSDILKIATEVAQIIRRAHEIPERVLHRDLRPSNIMLEGLYTRPEEWRVVVLDFDLSWHTGAEEKSVVYGAVTGYLAPEQLQGIRGVSTRHSAVDSFGLGMTLYYLVSGKDPLPAQHKHENWTSVVLAATRQWGRGEWWSLPNRYARLIARATQDRQAERWDVGQLDDEIERLRSAHLEPNGVVSAELVAEELAARATSEYSWDDNTATATIVTPAGVKVRVAGDEGREMIVLRLGWDSSGKENRRRVGRWLGSAAEDCVARLKKTGWSIVARNVQKPQSMAIEARVATTAAGAMVSRMGEVISEVTARLTFE